MNISDDNPELIFRIYIVNPLEVVRIYNFGIF